MEGDNWAFIWGKNLLALVVLQVLSSKNIEGGL